MPDYKHPNCHPFRRPHRKPQINFYAVIHAQKAFLTSSLGLSWTFSLGMTFSVSFPYFTLPVHPPVFLEPPTLEDPKGDRSNEREISGNGDEWKVGLGYMTRLNLAARVSLLGFISGKRHLTHIMCCCYRSTFRVSDYSVNRNHQEGNLSLC